MKKPNFIRALLKYLWILVTIPFYWVFVPNRNSKFSWGLWKRIMLFFVCLLFWWFLAPLYAIQDYKRDMKIYRQRGEDKPIKESQIVDVEIEAKL